MTNGGRTAGAEAEMNGREALAFAVSHMRKIVPHFRLTEREADDIVQNALLSTMVRGRMAGADGDRWSSSNLEKTLRVGVSRALGERDGGRLADARARHILRNLVTSEEGVLGRRLSSNEVDELADSLRQEIADVRTRPAEGYQRRLPDVSLDDPVVARRLDQQEAPAPSDSSTDYLEDEMLAGLLAADDARRRVWNHLAESAGVAVAPHGLVSQRDCDAATFAVRGRGGARNAASQWLNTSERQRDVNDTLFTPWPFASLTQREAIAEFLHAQPRYADGLWESACATARSADPSWVTPGGFPIAVF